MPKFLQKGVADEIWADIGNRQISLFGLPPKPVSEYCVPTKIEPTKLYLKHNPRMGSLISALEDAFGSKYTFDRADIYITVARKD